MEASGEKPDEPSSSDQTSNYNPETVAALAEKVEKDAEFERERIRAAQQRAGALVAVVAGVVTLGANQARETLSAAAKLGEGGQVVAAAALVLALVCLLVSAGFALFAATRPVEDWQLKNKELDDLTGEASVSQPKVQVQYNHMSGLVKRIKRQREGWKKLRRHLAISLVMLVVGLFFLIVHIAVFADRTVECNAKRGVTSTSAARTAETLGAPFVRTDTDENNPPPLKLGGPCGENTRSESARPLMAALPRAVAGVRPDVP